MRRVDNYHISAGRQQGVYPCLPVNDSNCGPHSEPPHGILAGIGVLLYLLDVFDRDQSGEIIVFVHDEELFDPVLVEKLFRIFKGDLRGRDRDQVFMGHHIGHRLLEIGFKAKVAVGQDADQLLVPDHRHARYPVTVHQFKRFVHLLFRLNRDGINDHPAFRLLDLIDFNCLSLYAHVPMDDPQTAFLGQADGRPGFGHRIHRRTNYGDFEADISCQQRRGVHIPRQDV